MTPSWILVAVLGFMSAPLQAETFRIDPEHSSVGFRIRHLVSKVSGRFTKFSGTFVYDNDHPKALSAEAEIDAASIDTGVSKRDDPLRSADFFDVERCPEITFKGAKVTGARRGSVKLHGNLTLRCITRPITLDLELGGTAKDPDGNLRAGATATTRINRKDFGLTWNKTLETGGLLVGDEVEITLDIQGIANTRQE